MNTELAVIMALLIGAVIGFVVGWVAFKQRGLDKQLEHDLQETRKNFQEYQSEVSTHISRTADLLGKIQETYETVQEHVFNGAQRLNLDSTRQSLLQPTSHYIDHQSLAAGEPDHKTIGVESQPPKDYAGS